MGRRRSGDRLTERLRRSDALTGAAFFAWALAPVAALLVLARARGQVWGGAWAALGAADQYRYLAWARDAAEHLLISNQFGGSGEHVYLHPMLLLSGLAWRLGASLQLAYLLWLPASLAVLIHGYRRYVARVLHDGWPRRCALALALFFFTPLLPALDYGQVFDRDMVNHAVIAAGAGTAFWQAWGYLPTLTALGLMPLYLLWTEAVAYPARRRPGRGTRWYAGWAAAAGLAVSWLHPWGGMTLLLVTGGLLELDRRLRGQRAILVPAAAALLPLAYYFLLWLGAGWGLADLQVSFDPQRPLWAIALAFAPLLALPAAAAAWAPAASAQASFQERALWLWPAAALVVYLLVDPSVQLPALQGITLPLAILAVRAWQRLGWGAKAAVPLVLVGLLAGMSYSAHTFYDYLRGGSVPYLLDPEDVAAIRHTAGSGPGLVLSSEYLGTVIPAYSGRPTWVAFRGLGPAATFRDRSRRVEALLDGRLDPARALRLVAASRARYVVADCAHRVDLEPLLPGARRARFGCATVYPVGGG